MVKEEGEIIAAAAAAAAAGAVSDATPATGNDNGNGIRPVEHSVVMDSGRHVRTEVEVAETHPHEEGYGGDTTGAAAALSLENLPTVGISTLATGAVTAIPDGVVVVPSPVSSFNHEDEGVAAEGTEAKDDEAESVGPPTLSEAEAMRDNSEEPAEDIESFDANGERTRTDGSGGGVEEVVVDEEIKPDDRVPTTLDPDYPDDPDSFVWKDVSPVCIAGVEDDIVAVGDDSVVADSSLVEEVDCDVRADADEKSGPADSDVLAVSSIGDLTASAGAVDAAGAEEEEVEEEAEAKAEAEAEAVAIDAESGGGGVVAATASADIGSERPHHGSVEGKESPELVPEPSAEPYAVVCELKAAAAAAPQALDLPVDADADTAAATTANREGCVATGTVPAPSFSLPSTPSLSPLRPSSFRTTASGLGPVPLPSALKKSSSSSTTTAFSAERGSDAYSLSKSLLLSLPGDSLHTVASFLETSDWAMLSAASKGANRACREVFRRVRMHGFRCATEIVTAWARGEHSDARELTALYIKSGVPIYPLCLGHSYHTLIWRLGIEAREMEQEGENNQSDAGRAGDANDNAGGSNNTPARPSPLDRFYTDRYDARARDGYYVPTLTYLEEKCLFWKHLALDGDSEFGRVLSPERRHSLSNAVSLRPPPPPPPPGAIPPQPLGTPHHFLPPGHRNLGVPGMPDLPPHFHGLPATRFPHPAAFNFGAGGGGGGNFAGLAHHGAGFRRGTPRRAMSSSNIAVTHPGYLGALRAQASSSGSAWAQPRHPKMAVRVHRHLLDRHLLGCPAVNDELGAMEPAPLSLSADFFHPHLSSAGGAAHPAAVYPSDYASPYGVGDEGGGAYGHPPLRGRAAQSSRFHQAPLGIASQATAAAASSHHAHTGGGGDRQPRVSQPAAMTEVSGSAPAGEEYTDGAGGIVATDPVDEAGLAGVLDFDPPIVLPHPYQPRHVVSFGSVPDSSSSLPALGIGDQDWGVCVGSEYSVLHDVALEVYSSTSYGLPKSCDDATSGKEGDGAKSSSTPATAGVPVDASKLRLLRTRFLSYQRKLDSLLAHFDSSGFDECILDFWDEFLPLTSGVHFYDRHTPVPRMASLQRFLTRPCPKSIGIVQCEIERIKISGRKGKKGVGVKGRLFPTYEYRLFIRDRRHGSVESRTGPPGKVRRDTVLMTAKNRGKNAVAAAAAGVMGSPSTPGNGKRGVNNYFLYMPQSSDVEQHFESVNDPSIFANNFIGNRSSTILPQPFQRPPPDGGTNRTELGRLQSNFIGTEFQIFSPCIVKNKQKGSTNRNPALSSSSGFSDSEDDEDDVASNRSGQSGRDGLHRSRRRSSSIPRTASRRTSRRSSFGRLSNAARRSLSRTRYGRGRSDAASNPSSHASDSVPTSQDAPTTPNVERQRSRHRRSSWSAIARSSKVASRRAIAANSPGGIATSTSAVEPVFGEEENGVITYTANLLGNRPRIMDVCIPRVLPEGTVSSVWRRYVESQTERDGGSGQQETMISRFKQLQQRLDNPPPPSADVNVNNNYHAIGGNNNGGDGGNDNGTDNPAGAGEAGLDVSRGDGTVGVGYNNPVTPDDFGLMALQNRPPWWNVELGAFVLNFGGRVSVASVKNFQLCDRSDQEHIMLQFGRIQGRHSFTMDFQYPLSAMQAFAIAISSLQSKISFG